MAATYDLNTLLVIPGLEKSTFRVVTVEPDGSVYLAQCDRRGNALTLPGHGRLWPLAHLDASSDVHPTQVKALRGPTSCGPIAVGDVVRDTTAGLLRFQVMSIIGESVIVAECDTMGNVLVDDRQYRTIIPHPNTARLVVVPSPAVFASAN